MCGIVGYVGPRAALPVLLSGLQRLEYRGYDSAGVALRRPDGFHITKRAGRVAALAEAVSGLTEAAAATSGIAHTRWATHGRPTDLNAHPHSDEEHAFAIVHNGIIENHGALRAELTARGHRFASETDTEVIVHLVEEAYAGDLAAAVRQVARRLQGSFALAVMARAQPDVLVGVRNQTPLVVGLGDGEGFLASDIAALLPYTRTVLILEDGDVATVRPDGATVTDFDGVERTRAPFTVQWDAARAERGGYAHFMAKEVHEQPAALRETLRGRIEVVGAAASGPSAADAPRRAVARLVEIEGGPGPQGAGGALGTPGTLAPAVPGGLADGASNGPSANGQADASAGGSAGGASGAQADQLPRWSSGGQADALSVGLPAGSVAAPGVTTGAPAVATALPRKVWLVACGTAYYACLVGKRLIEQWAGIEAEADIGSEFRYRAPLVRPGDWAVAVSQSGETADTLAALREARRLGAVPLAISNVVGASIPREALATIHTWAGPEIAVCSTKAYTTQLAVLTLLAGWLAQRRWGAAAGGAPLGPGAGAVGIAGLGAGAGAGAVKSAGVGAGSASDLGSRALAAGSDAGSGGSVAGSAVVARLALDEVGERLAQALDLPAWAEQALALEEPIRVWSERIAAAEHCFFIGRGLDWAVAQEGALKLKEISYVHAEAYAAGELKHGTLALVTEGTPVIAVFTQPELAEKTASNAAEVRARGGHVLGLCTPEIAPHVAPACDEALTLPPVPAPLAPAITVIPLQLLAYQTAVARGNDVDKPRNLAKSVTVE